MGLLSGIVKGIGNLVTAPLKMTAAITGGLAQGISNGINSIFGGDQQPPQGGMQGPSIFGPPMMGPRPFGPPPFGPRPFGPPMMGPRPFGPPPLFGPGPHGHIGPHRMPPPPPGFFG